MSQTQALQSKPSSTSSEELKLTIERSALIKALGHVQSVVERRNTIPVLANVKLEASSGSLSLTATDMDISVTERVDAKVEIEGALTVPAHTLYDIARKLPDGAEVQLAGDADSKGRLQINCGSCEFTLATLPVADFPVIDRGQEGQRFTLAAAELATLIDKTKFAISLEETRYYLNGIYLHTSENEGSQVLRSVATDGHRLARFEIACPEGAEKIPGVIIPRKAVAEIRKLLESGETEVEVFLSGVKIGVACGNAVLISKLIDGTFPDYEKVIPQGNPNNLSIAPAALSQAVDRVSTISSEKSRAIRLDLQEGKLTLSANSEENGEASEEIAVEYDGSAVEIAFNSRYVLELLSGIEGEANFKFADGGSPAIVTDSANEGALFVIMPMRI